MKIPFKPLALSAASMPSNLGRRAFVNDSTPTVLIGANTKIQVAEFTGDAFKTVLDATVPGNPSWLEFVEPNKLYAVDENASELRLFHLDPPSGNDSQWRLSKHPVATGLGSAGVVHMEFNKDHTRMVGSAYGNGTIDVWDTSDDELVLLATLDSTGTTGPHVRQTKPFPHEAVLDPSGRFFAVNDLGTDEILLLDSKDDSFTGVGAVPTPPGCGPRHGVFHTGHESDADADEATHYYVVCELSNQVVSYRLTYPDGTIAFHQEQVLSTFASGSPPSPAAAAGEIVLDAAGQNLYVSNRVIKEGMEDTLAHFRVNDGMLEMVGEVSTQGVNPRMFSISESGEEIFTVNFNGPENAVAALPLKEDGSIGDELLAAVPFAGFEVTGGPAYVKQIR